MPYAEIDELRQQAFEVLHAAGWRDTPIGAVLKKGTATIRSWREVRGLPVNARRDAKIDDQQARRMHAAGANDHEIARHFGVDPPSVTQWRHRRALPANVRQGNPISDAKRRAARRMLRLGAAIAQVAEEIGISIDTVKKIRSPMCDPGLRQQGVGDRAVRARVLKDPHIGRRIERAIGLGLPADVRAEACGDLYADVLDGLVGVEMIEEAAPRYRNRAFDLCGSKFGPRSLDDELCDGFTLGDTIEDEAAYQAMDDAAEAAFGRD